MDLHTVKVRVDSGETSLIRVINAALNQQLFFTIANHKLTVVGADGSYVKPFTTPVLMLGPGQTTDILMQANQAPARYYIAARAYASGQGVPFDNTTTTAVLEYKTATSKPIMPPLPAYNDTATVTAFTTRFKSLRIAPVPTVLDHSLFITMGLGINQCPPKTPAQNCQAPNRSRFAASMNNVSFVFPSKTSILEAHYHGIPGVFTTDFPAKPSVTFDYTGNVSRSLWQPNFGTKVYKLKYGARVQIVLQGTSIFTPENHPIHLHGYDFYILAEGFGNFNPKTDTAKFNLVDPPLRNTVSLPIKGWAVIRFVANNPGKENGSNTRWLGNGSKKKKKQVESLTKNKRLTIGCKRQAHARLVYFILIFLYNLFFFLIIIIIIIIIIVIIIIIIISSY
ncbi:putative laccase [Helianthus anomalus]